VIWVSLVFRVISACRMKRFRPVIQESDIITSTPPQPAWIGACNPSHTDIPMSQYWSAVVHSLTPYVPGEQPKMDNLVKLNTNEHPFGPSPRALEAIRAATQDSLRLYPDPNSDALKSALAKHHGVQASQIFVGNGSDEVLAHAFMALLKRPGGLWFPDITYSFYPVYCGLYGIDYQTIPLASDFTIRVEDYLPHDGKAAGAIIFPTPTHRQAAPCRWLMSSASWRAIRKRWC